MTDDRQWMGQAIALGEAARGRSAPNPNVGCVIVSSSGKLAGKGATASGGRPHAEAVALQAAGAKAKGATFYVTLEPCAHASERGPACIDLLLQAKPARVVIALKDPDTPHRRQKHQAAPRRRDRGDARRRSRGREAFARGLAYPAQARPSADYIEAGAVDRREDRAAFGRIRSGSPERTLGGTFTRSGPTAT